MNPQFLVGMSGDFTTLVTPSWIPWKGRCFRWGHRHLHLQVGIGDGPWVSLARSTLWKMPNKNGKTVWVVRSDEGEPALIIASSMFTPKTWRNPRTHHISTPHGQATPPIRRDMKPLSSGWHGYMRGWEKRWRVWMDFMSENGICISLSILYITILYMYTALLLW